MKIWVMIKKFTLFFLFCCIACGGGHKSAGKCRLEGEIDVTGGGGPSAVKIVLENVSNPDYSNITYSNSDGKFVLEEIEPGFYYLNASKDGYDWILTKIYDHDDHVIHRGSSVTSFELVAGTTTKVLVRMSNNYYYGSDDGDARDFKILDMNGNPTTSLEIQNGDESAGFQLYNGTGHEVGWSVYNGCVWTSYDNFHADYCFKSINPEKGTLEPGKSISVLLEVDPLIYSYEVRFPYDDIEIWTNLKTYNLQINFASAGENYEGEYACIDSDSYWCNSRGECFLDSYCYNGCDIASGKCKTDSGNNDDSVAERCNAGTFTCKTGNMEYSYYCDSSDYSRYETCKNGCNSSTGKCNPWKDPDTNLTWSSLAQGLNWNEAVSYCNTLSEGGFSNWRLPDIDELRTLIVGCPKTVTGGSCPVSEKNSCLFFIECYDSENCSCARNSSGEYNKFEEGNELGEEFWSSSVSADLTNSAAVVGFCIAEVGFSQKSNPHYVRCVR